LLLARLFALPANVLVLDEPTNDLDIDTLELLEELLQDYAGTLFLVSHDRRFLDNVVTSTIAWEGEDRPGLWREYEGGYSDWKLQRARARELQAAAAAPVATPAPAPTAALAAATTTAPKPRSGKLSWKEQRELEDLPARIESLEVEQREIAATLAGREVYVNEPQRVAQLNARHAQIEDELMAALERWEQLGSR
jgi:ATP-binding cassette subfamily F protein uup